MLCAQRFEIEPESLTMGPDFPATLAAWDTGLLIGDPAFCYTLPEPPTLLAGPLSDCRRNDSPSPSRRCSKRLPRSRHVGSDMLRQVVLDCRGIEIGEAEQVRTRLQSLRLIHSWEEPPDPALQTRALSPFGDADHHRSAADGAVRHADRVQIGVRLARAADLEQPEPVRPSRSTAQWVIRPCATSLAQERTMPEWLTRLLLSAGAANPRQ